MNNLTQDQPLIDMEADDASAVYCFAASYAQQRLWVIDQLLEDRAAYNLSAALRIREPLRLDALDYALRSIIERHDSLRTTFSETDGIVSQIIRPSHGWTLVEEEVEGSNADERQAHAAQLALAEARTPFDLEAGPLFRFRLLRLEATDYLLLVTMHHIISDGWSTGIIIRELSELYPSFLSGRAAGLPELPIQYADFAHYQRDRMSSEDAAPLLDYWRHKLGGELPVLQLAGQSPYTGQVSDRGHTLAFQIPCEMSEPLRRLGQAEGATFFMTLLAAYYVWLYRYSNQTDLLVGTPVAGREAEELEGIVGFFVNSVAIRIQIRPEHTFRQLLEDVKTTVVEAFAHQEVPFDKVVEMVQPDRQLGRTPIFQTMFTVHQRHISSDAAGLAIELWPVERDSAKFDLSLDLEESQDGLSGLLEYRADAFEREAAQRMVRHFTELLASIAVNPDAAISRLAMLTEAETAQQLQEWNFSPEGGSALAEEPSFLSRIEAMAARHGQRTAIRCEEQRLSYSELNRRANKLAHRLQAIGIGPDARVGICLERSVELVVALLGVAKAGGAYVPLAPSLPAERLAYMLRNAKVQALVSRQAELDEAEGGERLAQAAAEQGAELVLLDRDAALLSQEAETNPAASASAAHTMYVIFTSGSTGLPKGAIVYRKGFANLLKWYTEAFGMDEQDKVLLVSSPSFDLTQKNIFAPLMTGGELVLLPSGVYDPAEVSSLIDTHGITLWNGTPSAFYPLLEESEPSGYSELRTLRYVFLGGEAIAAERLLPWTASESCRAGIVNTYGPTECTDVTVYGIVERLDELAGKAVPIGRPVPGTQAYILNEGLGLLPSGAIGELCLAGVQVGGGYVGDEEKTATQFVPNPYGTGKLYRTGDLARYLADGTIAYLGRRDHQVKIRGYRIEPGEVEAALRLCEGVKDAAVVAREDRPGEKRLVAYVVLETMEAAAPAEVALGGAGQAAESRGGRDTDRQQDQQQLVRAHDSHGAEGDSDWARHLHEERLRALRQELKERLPEYMMPETLLRLEQLPLSPNGKVDRKALPKPEERAGDGREESYVAPRNAVEAAMAAIWAEVLQVERVGIYDHFFERGGHSLLAMQAVSRMRRELGTSLSLRLLFEYPTISELSEAMGVAEPAYDSRTVITPLPLAARAGGLPLSYTQKRLWLLNQMDPDSTAYHIFASIQITGPLDVERLRHSFNAVLERHEALRTVIRGDTEPMQYVLPFLSMHLPMDDLRQLSADQQAVEVRERSRREAEQPFELAHGPLLRASLLRLQEQEYLLLICQHHILSDGWSIGILIRELNHFYHAATLGVAANLPQLALQFGDYAAWQQSSWETESKRLTDYWLEQLGGELPVLELPRDYERSQHPLPRGRIAYGRIEQPASQAMLDICRRERATPFMFLLAVFSVLLGRIGSQEDVVIGAPVAGRERPELERLIGCFINSVALRVDLSGNPRFLELLAQVRTVCLGAYEHQSMPFEKLVELLQPERMLSGNPIYDVMLNYIHASEAAEPGETVDTLSWTTLEQEEPQAKFALTLYVKEEEDGLALELSYRADLFSAARMEELLRQFGGLVARIIEEDNRPIRSYSLVTASSVTRLPDVGAPIATRPFRSVPDTFAAVARQLHAMVAVKQRGRELTYGQLLRATQAIGGDLTARGLKSGDVVAIAGLRSFGLVASTLGALAAGGTILMIPAHTPPERREEWLGASGASWLLYIGQPRSGDELLLQRFAGSALLLVDEGLEGLEDQMTLTLPDVGDGTASPIQADDAAYIFFTSGTTGKPKGIVGRHSGLSHFLDWQRMRFGIGPGDRGAQLTSLSFDVVLRDLFLPLTSGAALILPDQEEDVSAVSILPWMQQEGITYLHTVPALAQSWLSTATSGAGAPTLRYVFFAGEPLTGALIRTWRERWGEHTTFINLYGPTETTLAKCCYIVPGHELQQGIQPIGKPLPETQLIILNPERQLCGIGETGEIVIRTPYRSLGYLEANAEQRAAFVPNPFTKDPDDILYFTGDLGEYLPDGSIAISGRLDDQVKIRGMRVDLSEIQAVIASHPDIQANVVLPWTSAGDVQPVAYYMTRGDLRPQQLRAYVRGKLPSYMMPAVFIAVESLPLTPNGKVDRKRLPDPAACLSLQDTAAVLPQTELERTISEVWCSLLGRQQVGIYDHFFEIGGHSLLLLAVKSRLAERLERDIPVVDLFQYPTIQSLAAHLARIEAPSIDISASAERAHKRQHALRQRRERLQVNHQQTDRWNNNEYN
ncbi:non-ribosomal peptide synthetase [Paenibacillus sp. SYP-B4298]|uniref:non-ribosomal peptide synthetase n=1 Tax=Paenibacillus sp. SYP-B4298 TaxID=2996034 RepID=UPI0022DE39CF|nr:non-ribosomal peptide synthetase [Paenibacillus sp. SYP-B4298]